MDFIKFFDIFDIKFHFFLNKQPNYQNVFGGIMSISFYIICIAAFFIFSYEDLSKLNPTSSKSEIPDAGRRTVNILQEKIWIPFRMVTYEEQFVDHRGLLFPQLYYVEGKWDDKIGMDLKYHLLTYKLCNETSIAKKPDSFKINVPLNELFCAEADEMPFGGSWNGNYLHFLEYNVHLCQGGINFNASDPRCTKLEDLLKHRSTSWLFEFYYPVVQFQPTNYDVPLAVIYRSYFYRLATHSNKVERIYISQHILNDDQSILNSNSKNISCWGMSSLYGDDYYMEYNVDPLVKSTSSRLYSLDIYMDQGMVYYTRSYKKLFLIVSDFFPILKFILFVMKRCTQHFKMSSRRRRLAGLLFENVNLKKKIIERSSHGSLYPSGNKLIIETNNNSKKELRNKNNTNEGNNSYVENQASNNEFFMNINKHRKNLKSINLSFFGNSHMFKNKNSESDIVKNNVSNNKSNMSLNHENIIQILNKQTITKLNSNNKKSMTLFSKIKDTYNTNKRNYKRNKNEIKGEKKKELFPYLYFFLDLFFDKFEKPKKFCGIPRRYFILYNFMGQIYDISTHILLLKKFNNLYHFILKNCNSTNYPFEKESKININDKNMLIKLNNELRNSNCIIFTNSILRY